MAFYLVYYSLGANKDYSYPKSIAGVVWKLTMYHFTDHVMVGETDDKVKTDGKHVISLTPKDAKNLIKKYEASYPKPRNLPAPLQPARK
jgi:hypothetical protein